MSGSPRAALLYLVEPLAVEAVKTLPCPPPHVTGLVLIHALHTAGKAISGCENGKGPWVRQGHSRVKARGTAPRRYPDNPRSFDVDAPEFGAAQAVFGRVFGQRVAIVFADAVFKGKPQVAGFVLRDAARIVFAEFFLLYRRGNGLAIIAENAFVRGGKPDRPAAVFQNARHVDRRQRLKRGKCRCALLVGNRIVPEYTTMRTHPNRSRPVDKDAFAGNVEVGQPVFLRIIPEGFAVVPVNALVGPEPHIALPVFVDGKNGVIDKSGGTGKIGQRFAVVPHHAFANGAEP